MATTNTNASTVATWTIGVFVVLAVIGWLGGWFGGTMPSQTTTQVPAVTTEEPAATGTTAPPAPAPAEGTSTTTQ